MLILSRKLNDEIIIGDDIVISILGIEGDRVRIGIDAPKSYTILRGELAAAVKSSNIESAGVTTEMVDKLKIVFKENNNN